jgi:Domain of unknown function (DUF5911)
MGERTLSSKIEVYGLIGDCQTAALVGRDGSNDWLCWPFFDSDARFAALIGDRKNGRSQITPAKKVTASSRRYAPLRGWHVDPGDAVRDRRRRCGADRFHAAVGPGFRPRPPGPRLRGKVKMRMELVIRFGFGNDIPGVRRNEDGTAPRDRRARHDRIAHAGRVTHIALINTAHNLDQLRKESQKPAMQRSQ